MPKYLPETDKQYRCSQMTKARVNDQLGFKKIDKDSWWKEPLATLGGRAPADFYDSDPLAVFLAAKHGITRDGEAASNDAAARRRDAAIAAADPTADDNFQPDSVEGIDVQPLSGVVESSNGGVREDVSAEELDAIKESDTDGKGDTSGLPSWWT